MSDQGSDAEEEGQFGEFADLFVGPEDGTSTGGANLTGPRAGVGAVTTPTRRSPSQALQTRQEAPDSVNTAGKSQPLQGVVHQPTLAELEADPDPDGPMCCAIVGTERFCIQLASSCGYSSHKKAPKFLIRPGALYIGSGSSRAYCGPVLMVEDLKPDETPADLLGRQKGEDSWRSLFHLWSTGQHGIDSDGSSDSDRDEDDMNEDELRLMNEVGRRIGVRTRRRAPEEEDPREDEEDEKLISAAAFERVLKRLAKLEVEHTLLEANNAALSKNQYGLFKTVEALAEQLVVLTGEDLPVLQARCFNHVVKESSALETRLVKDLKQDLATACAGPDERVTNLANVFRVSSGNLKQKLSSLTSDMAAIKRRGTFGRPGLGTHLYLDLTRAAQTDLDGLKLIVDGVRAHQQNSAVVVPPAVLSRIADLEKEAAAWLQGPVGTEAYTLEGHQITGVPGVIKALGSCLKDLDTGVFVDLFGALNSIEGSGQTAKEYAEK